MCEQKSGGFRDCAGPYFALLNSTARTHVSAAGFSGPALPKVPLLCRGGWKQGALESASINVKLCSIAFKQLSSEYFCPHLNAERGITLSLMVFAPGVVRAAGFGSQGGQGRAKAASAQQPDRTERRGVSGEGRAWQGAQHGLRTFLKHCPAQCYTCLDSSASEANGACSQCGGEQQEKLQAFRASVHPYLNPGLSYKHIPLPPRCIYTPRTFIFLSGHKTDSTARVQTSLRQIHSDTYTKKYRCSENLRY